MGKPRSSNRIALTSATLRSTYRPSEGVDVVWDEALTGFGLRTRGHLDPSRWTWIFSYRHKNTGAQVKRTLGAFIGAGHLTPEEARRRALDCFKAANTTADPWEVQKRELKAAAETKARTTVTELWTAYRERGGALLKSAADYERLWNLHLEPFFGRMKVADVEPDDVERFKVSMKATPIACNRSLSVLSAMMTKAVLWKLRAGCSPENPVAGVERYKERKVHFHFSPEDLGNILLAADGYETGGACRTSQGRRLSRNQGFGVAVWMLALTGARASEVLKAHWGQLFECEGGGMIWTVETTKNGHPVERFLPEELASRLREWMPKSLAIMKARQGEAKKAPLWFFPQLNRPELPVNRMEKAWLEIKAAAGVSKGRIHDLRHTAATLLRRHGRPLTDIQQQLAHTSGRTTERYAHVMPERAAETGALLGSIAANAVAASLGKQQKKAA